MYVGISNNMKLFAKSSKNDRYAATEKNVDHVSRLCESVAESQ